MGSKISEFVTAVRQESLAEFVANHPGGFLIIRDDSGEEPGTWSFRTSAITADQVEAARVLQAEGLSLKPGSENIHVAEVAKAGNNPWGDRISVGRASNTDVVLPHHSVSKLHAHFTTQGSNLLLTDAGSRNGTLLNGAEIKSGEATTVKSGDHITFGTVSTQLLDAEQMFEFIGEQLTPREEQ